MRKRLFLLILAIPFFIASCKKDSFPGYEDLIGTWTEANNLLDQQILVFDDHDTLFYYKTFSRYINPADTFLYRLDNNSEMLCLRLAGSPDNSESQHKLQWNDEKNEITIWGLMISIPESPSVTTFIKQ